MCAWSFEVARGVMVRTSIAVWGGACESVGVAQEARDHSYFRALSFCEQSAFHSYYLREVSACEGSATLARAVDKFFSLGVLTFTKHHTQLCIG